MSAIPAGAVPITFAVDKTLVNQYLAELRQGFTVPVRPTFTGGAASAGEGPIGSIGGGGSNGNGLAASGGRGGVSEADREAQRAERERAARIRRVDSAWDRAALAEQKAAERAEAAAREQEQETASASGGRRGGGGGSGGSDRVMGLRLGRIRQYATVGFLAMEGLRVAEAYRQRSEDLQFADQPIDRATAEMRFANQISGVPVVGQAADLILSPFRNSAQAAIRNAQHSLTDEQEQARRQSQVREANREAARFDILSGPARQEQAIRDNRDEREIQFREETNRRRQNIDAADPSDGAEIGRRTDEYNRFVQGNRIVLDAESSRDDARIDEIRRQVIRTKEREARFGPELNAAAEGQFGVARERGFMRQLAQEEADADLVSPNYARLVRSNNILRRGAEREEIEGAINYRDAETLGLSYEISRDPLRAQITRIKASGARALSQARPIYDPITGRVDEQARTDRASINDNVTAQIVDAQQRQQDEYDRRRYAIGTRNEQLGILGDFTTDPATRELRSQVDAIRRRTQMQALGVFQEDEGEGRKEAPGIFRGGQLELQALQQRYLSSFRAEEVNPNRTALSGSGTEDPTALLKSIDDTIKELKKVPQSLDDIKAALQSALVAQ